MKCQRWIPIIGVFAIAFSGFVSIAYLKTPVMASDLRQKTHDRYKEESGFPDWFSSDPFSETSKDKRSSDELCAFLSYGERCGFANSGRRVYAQNNRRNKRSRATIKVEWRSGIEEGQYQDVETIPAGGRSFLGCSRSSSIGPSEYFSFEIVGCEMLSAGSGC